MCLGIPAQLVAGETGHPDLVMAEVGGVPRTVNVGLLDERPGPGDWILVHMGFALNVMTPEEAADALDALGAEREAEDREAAERRGAAGRTRLAARRRRCTPPWTPRSRKLSRGGCHERARAGLRAGRPAAVRQVRLSAERAGLLRPRDSPPSASTRWPAWSTRAWSSWPRRSPGRGRTWS